VLYNLSYPTWTYDNLVFASFKSVQIPESYVWEGTVLEGVSITMKTPALRPSLNFVVAPPSNTTQGDNFYTLTEVQSSDGWNAFIPESIQALPGVYGYMNVTFP
jgi:hypothetical protein